MLADLYEVLKGWAGEMLRGFAAEKERLCSDPRGCRMEEPAPTG